jgi:hypothetical protein
MPTDVVKGTAPAQQARNLGLRVGEVIIGRKEIGTNWHEVKLELIFLGRQVCVWKVSRRTQAARRWRSEGESAHWDLSCRTWRKLKSA